IPKITPDTLTHDMQQYLTDRQSGNYDAIQSDAAILRIDLKGLGDPPVLTQEVNKILGTSGANGDTSQANQFFADVNTIKSVNPLEFQKDFQHFLNDKLNPNDPNSGQAID